MCVCLSISVGGMLCLALLLSSEDQLLSIYRVFLPGMAFIFAVFEALQLFVGKICYVEPIEVGWVSGLASYIRGKVHYFDGAPASEVNCDCFWVILVVAGVVCMGVIFYAKPIATHPVNNIMQMMRLIVYSVCPIPLFLVELVVKSQSDGFLHIRTVFRVLSKTWILVYVLRMVIICVYDALGVEVTLSIANVWRLFRRPLFVSWPVAYLIQLLDRFLADEASDTSYIEMMVSTLRHGSWTPVMYVGLCTFVGHLMDAVWRLVYLVLVRKLPDFEVTDPDLLGITELLTLTEARIVCSVLHISTDVITFPMPILVGLLTIKWICRGIQSLLFSDDRRTRVRAATVYLASIIAAPMLVFVSLASEDRFWAVSMCIAVRPFIRMASILIRNLVERRNFAVFSVVFVSTFMMVSTVWSVFCLLFYSQCPRAQPFVKVGAHAPVPHGVGATGWWTHGRLSAQ